VATETSPYQEPVSSAARTSGWDGSDLALGSALIVLLIALFLPWFSETVHLGHGTAPVSGTGDGLRAHGYLWAVLALTIVALAVLVARDAITRLPGNLPSPGQMLAGATGLSFLLTVLGLAFRPSGYTTSGSAAAVQQVFGQVHVSVGWSYGGFVAVLAALIAFIAAFGIAGPLESAYRAARAATRHPGKAA
jgi:hypothetical protein